MANQAQLDILRKGVKAWNRWRYGHRTILPDLSGADLNGADLNNANLSEATLTEANLIGADLSYANLGLATLTGADLSAADLAWADLRDAKLYQTIFHRAKLQSAVLWRADNQEAHLAERYFLARSGRWSVSRYRTDFRQADLTDAYLRESKLKHTDFNMANLCRADLQHSDLRESNFYIATLYDALLTGADLRGADLRGVNFVKANLDAADLTGCRIYGVAAWSVKMRNTIQSNLIITDDEEATITVDDLKVAQFIYLILNNREIRDVIDTISKKAVLILGRFSQERKLVLDALREKLRGLNYLPIVFDFERPTERDFTETIMTLAGLCRFIIADITNPKSSPLELQATVPNYMIPFVPIIQEGEKPFAMFEDLQRKYNWVLDRLEYDTLDNLINVLEKAIVEPALVKHKELMANKVEQLPTRHVKDYS